ncbi:MAG: serine/threonine-protein kinase [Vulcanimicrobiota bacterium]
MASGDDTVFASEGEREQARQLSEVAPQLDGYDLGELLGAGAFGRVYAGTQTRTGQAVAVKILRRETFHWHYFEHELRKLTQVAEHPHVVSLLDADPDHQPPYYVMPLLAGSLEGKRPELDELVDWLVEIAEALGYMHGKGLLHCDLKPSNVLLDAQGRARLVDFGQARNLAETGASFGTLGYMPPEQAAPEAQPDALWDVYAFGATAYRLLTGQCPRFSDHDRTEITATSELTERLRLYREKVANRPLTPLAELRPDVDPDLACIIEACLRIQERTPSIHQVLEDFRRRRRGEPLMCQRPWTTRYQVVRFLRRPLVAAALLVAVVFPLFVNSYLTIKAQYAITELVLHEAHLLNRAATPDSVPPGDYRHLLIAPDGQVLSPTGTPSIDLAAIEAQCSRLDRGIYYRDGQEWVGAWSRRGADTLLTERAAGPALETAHDILAKNRLLNVLILVVAAVTVAVVIRSGR